MDKSNDSKDIVIIVHLEIGEDSLFEKKARDR